MSQRCNSGHSRPSLDHLVGAREQRWWNVEAEPWWRALRAASIPISTSWTDWHRRPGGAAVAVDARIWPARRSHADPRLAAEVADGSSLSKIMILACSRSSLDIGREAAYRACELPKNGDVPKSSLITSSSLLPSVGTRSQTTVDVGLHHGCRWHPHSEHSQPKELFCAHITLSRSSQLS
jgi:hypothetical protein